LAAGCGVDGVGSFREDGGGEQEEEGEQGFHAMGGILGRGGRGCTIFRGRISGLGGAGCGK
jgi:hypothetical protein